jgi:plasmid stabilization system protein ParE
MKVLEASFAKLVDLSDQGRSIDLGTREMIVPFGGSIYVIRYEVDEDSVFIARIWHGLEDREP